MNKVYVVAEIGINHSGSIDKAKWLINAAARTGVDAVKFQTYHTDQRAFRNSAIYPILKKCELPLEAFEKLKKYTEMQYNMDFFSTPFDVECVDYLESIGCALYKISSFSVSDHRLLERISQTGMRVIMSTGKSNLAEIRQAYNIIKAHTGLVGLLHCVSNYPTKEKDANLSKIHVLKKEFPGCFIGQSDHTDNIVVPLYAVAAGARIIEKHFKIDEDCVDAKSSIDERVMRHMVIQIRRLEGILGE